MNNRAILTIGIILSFAAGFMSAEMLSVSNGRGVNITEVVSNSTKIMIINDRDYYPVALQLINNASKSIHIVMFEMVWYGNPDEDHHNVSKLGKALVAAHERSVEVKVILENGWSYGGFEYSNIPDYAKNWKNYFESKGIEVKFDWSNETTHDKLIIIDDEIVIVGSTNWSQSALNYNHEANAVIDDKKVANSYEDYFQELWNKY